MAGINIDELILRKRIIVLEKENEELKEEIINKNEKIKELRFSVSDLTNRLCNLNAEKSFKIVDLEQTLKEIKKIAEENLDKADRYLIIQKISEVKDVSSDS